MNERDASRLDLMRAVERYLTAHALVDVPTTVTDVVAVVRHLPAGSGDNVHRAILGTTGFRDVPLDTAIDMLEDGFEAAWDMRREAAP